MVFDTNVLIPLILHYSRSSRLFSRLRVADWRVVSTPQILAEATEKMRTKRRLRRWLGTSDDRIDRFLGRLPRILQVYPGFRQVHGAVPADPKDDKVIAAAVEANASYIVSEDRHLRQLGEYQGIKIMSVEEFHLELDRLGVGRTSV